MIKYTKNYFYFMYKGKKAGAKKSPLPALSSKVMTKSYNMNVMHFICRVTIERTFLSKETYTVNSH